MAAASRRWENVGRQELSEDAVPSNFSPSLRSSFALRRDATATSRFGSLGSFLSLLIRVRFYQKRATWENSCKHASVTYGFHRIT